MSVEVIVITSPTVNVCENSVLKIFKNNISASNYFTKLISKRDTHTNTVLVPPTRVYQHGYFKDTQCGSIV